MVYIFNSDWVPPNYTWDEKGLSTTKYKESIICSNAVPIVTRNYVRKHAVTGAKEEHIEYCYLLKDGSNTEIQTLNMMQINKFAFMYCIPRGVVVYAEGRSKAKYAFHTIMQLQLAEMPCEVVPVYDYGWNNHYYYTGDFQPKFDEADTAVHVLNLMLAGNNVVSGCLLAGLHGYLTKLLFECGVEHNFTTYIFSEKSSIGKTSVATSLVATFLPKTNFISILGKKSEVKKIAATIGDCPLVLDDVAKIPSNRITENLLASTAEITQTSSDAGAVVVDGNTVSMRGHNIITAQIKLNNPTTINRYYYCEMVDELDPELWQLVSGFKNKSSSFYYHFVNFVTNNYENIVNNIQATHPYYVKKFLKIDFCQDNSNKRIAATLAVQETIKQVLYLYFSTLNIDADLIKNAFKATEDAILKVGYDTGLVIDEINKRAYTSKYIFKLYLMIKNLKCDDYGFIANSENKYRKFKTKTHFDKGYAIGFWTDTDHDYLAFNSKILFEHLQKKMSVEDGTERLLIKELSSFELLRISTSKEKCYKWYTDYKYHYLDCTKLYTLIEEINRKKFGDVFPESFYVTIPFR